MCSSIGTPYAALRSTHQPAIARLEAGEHEPTIGNLRRVAHALGTALVIELDSERGREELAKL